MTLLVERALQVLDDVTRIIRCALHGDTASTVLRRRRLHQTTEQLVAADGFDPASYEDGFTVSFTLNSDNSWSASTSGLSSDINTNGTVVGTFYNDIAGNAIVSSFYQSATANADLINYDSVSLTTLPEPATIGLLIVGYNPLICNEMPMF